VDAIVRLEAVALLRVSVQLKEPRFVAAVELPPTREGSARLAGAVTLNTPALEVPVTVCEPDAVAAKAGWIPPRSARRSHQRGGARCARKYDAALAELAPDVVVESHSNSEVADFVMEHSALWSGL
jgi:hypothetical protein